MNRVFIDVETGGLDVTRHDIIEVAWVTDTGDPKRLVLPHRIERLDERALEINGYFTRGVEAERHASAEQVWSLWVDLLGATLVATNPTFDRLFLSTFFRRMNLEPEPWHHRSLDVESMAAVMFGETSPVGMKAIADRLNSEYDARVPEPDHSALGDVEALRECAHFIEDWRTLVGKQNAHPVQDGRSDGKLPDHNDRKPTG